MIPIFHGGGNLVLGWERLANNCMSIDLNKPRQLLPRTQHRSRWGSRMSSRRSVCLMSYGKQVVDPRSHIPQPFQEYRHTLIHTVLCLPDWSVLSSVIERCLFHFLVYTSPSGTGDFRLEDGQTPMTELRTLRMTCIPGIVSRTEHWDS